MEAEHIGIQIAEYGMLVGGRYWVSDNRRLVSGDWRSGDWGKRFRGSDIGKQVSGGVLLAISADSIHVGALTRAPYPYDDLSL